MKKKEKRGGKQRRLERGGGPADPPLPPAPLLLAGRERETSFVKLSHAFRGRCPPPFFDLKTEGNVEGKKKTKTSVVSFLSFSFLSFLFSTWVGFPLSPPFFFLVCIVILSLSFCLSVVCCVSRHAGF